MYKIHGFLEHGRLRDDNIVSASKVYFSKHCPSEAQSSSNTIASLSLRHILDAVSMTLIDLFS